MAFPSPPPYFDPANTARQTRGRYRFQDECVALRCVQNLVTDGLRAVVVEWSSDYLAFPIDGPAELVSIKHREVSRPAWPASELCKPIADLYRYWREMPPPCRCAFVSNLVPGHRVVDQLATLLPKRLAIPDAEAQRFLAEDLDLGLRVPHRIDITAVALDTMRGALLALNRDPVHAEDCYTALLERIRQASTEEPPTVRERATRLAGSMRAVLAEGPDLPAQTLKLADLRALVQVTHDDLAGEAGPSQAPPRPPAPAGRSWAGGVEIRLEGGEFLLHEPVEERQAPDGSHHVLAAPARQLAPVAGDVWLRRVRVLRDTSAAWERLEALRREASLMQALATTPGVPKLIATAEEALCTTLVVQRPGGGTLLDTLGPLQEPYPPFAVDALLRGLPALGRVLAALHEHGHAHRDLRPDALLVTASRLDLSLRDLGLATVAVTPGEGPDGYRAPEQDRPRLTAPGPPTDAYQLAAVVYHALTGHLPGRSPVPPSLLRLDLSHAVDEVLLPALAESLAHRPPIRRLCSALAGLVGAAVVIPQ